MAVPSHLVCQLCILVQPSVHINRVLLYKEQLVLKFGVPIPSRSKVRSKSNFGLKVILGNIVVLRANPMTPTPFGHLGPRPR